MNNKIPLIAVIVPVHNTEEFLPDCINSIINQSHKNLEILFIDDDSSDGSGKIIKKYQSRDSRIKYTRTVHHNAAFTRSEGIAQSKADFVCFVDSDDVIHKDYVKTLYKTLASSNVSISTGKIKIVNSNNSILDFNEEKDTYNVSTEADLLAFFCDHYNWESGDYAAQSMCCKMFARDLFNNIDYSVIKNTMMEDSYTVSQAFRNSKIQSIALVDATLYHYRQNPDSTTSNTFTRKFKYDDREIGYTELLNITMDYISNLYRDHKNVQNYINKIKVHQYYYLALPAADKNILIDDMKNKIQELETDQYRLEKRIKALLNSRSFRLGLLMSSPVRFFKHIIKSVQSDN